MHVFKFMHVTDRHRRFGLRRKVARDAKKEATKAAEAPEAPAPPMKRHRSKTSGVKAEKEEKPPVVKEEKTDVEGRPPVMAKGSATVYYLHGKLHRNESSQCFRAFPEASGRHDRKYPFKNQAVEVAWAKALTYLEEHAKERAEAHANAVDVS